MKKDIIKELRLFTPLIKESIIFKSPEITAFYNKFTITLQREKKFDSLQVYKIIPNISKLSRKQQRVDIVV